MHPADSEGAGTFSPRKKALNQVAFYRLRKNSEGTTKGQFLEMQNHQPTFADRSLSILVQSIFCTFREIEFFRSLFLAPERWLLNTPANPEPDPQQTLAAWANALACPACYRPLRIAQDQITCTACHRTYPILDGIPVLIPDRAVKQTF